MINIIIFSGATPAASKVNFISWLDNLVSRNSGMQVIAYDCDGYRLPGCYHHLTQDNLFIIESKLSSYTTWGQQCMEKGIGAGRYIVIAGAGFGQCTLVHINLGPFVGPQPADK